MQRGGRTLFRGLSFVLNPGDMIAVRGPNGAGKSTLLRIVAGLLQPTEGHIALAPKGEAEEGAIAHYVGHLDGLKTALSVHDNLNFWRSLWGGSASVPAALDAVGLGDLAGLRAGVLSAGQRRRLALARLLMAPRPLWLLDEPTTALDDGGEALFGALLGRHLGEGGMALVATHGDLPVKAMTTLWLGGRP